MFCKPLYVYDAHVKKILKLHDALFVGDLNLDGISYDIWDSFRENCPTVKML